MLVLVLVFVMRITRRHRRPPREPPRRQRRDQVAVVVEAPGGVPWLSPRLNRSPSSQRRCRRRRPVAATTTACRGGCQFGAASRPACRPAGRGLVEVYCVIGGARYTERGWRCTRVVTDCDPSGHFTIQLGSKTFEFKLYRIRIQFFYSPTIRLFRSNLKFFYHTIHEQDRDGYCNLSVRHC